MDGNTPEQQLIKLACEGDGDAFGELVRRNQKKIYAFVLGMVGNPDDAFDVAQDAFMKAYRSITHFKGDSAFYTWMYSICRNCCYDFLKSQKRSREKSISLYEYQNDDEGTIIEIPDKSQAPDTLYEQQHARQLVMDAIFSLSDSHREIVLMRDVNGMSYEEIAQAMGITEGTVKSRLNRARLRLQQLLKDKL